MLRKKLFAFNETRTTKRTVFIEADGLQSALKHADEIRKDLSKFDLQYVDDDEIVYYALSRKPERDEP